jgi:hypothetical protein
MPRKERPPRPLAETHAEQELIVFLEERAARTEEGPLTAEEFARELGEAEAARRLARLKDRAAPEESR